MKRVFKQLESGNYQELDACIFSEAKLKILGGLINANPNHPTIIKELVSQIPKLGRIFDWNVGSILQHTNVYFIIPALHKINDPRLFNSIGLTWVLGEFRNTDRIIIDFLYNVIKNATDSDAWWRAAFSIEKLGIEEAVNLLKMSLKTQKFNSLNYYLDNIKDKKSVISILILSNVENIEQAIYPQIKKKFLNAKDDSTIINCCWLIGRLKLIDRDIYKKLLTLISHENYELKYYTFFALQNNAAESLRPILEKALRDNDPLIRKMATRGLISIGNEKSLNIIDEILYKESEQSVIGELSRAIYYLKNPTNRTRLLLEMKSYRNENGMISDESDKWYLDPSIYHAFSEAEDPENVCFSLIQEKIKNLSIHNPIDLATGTGRMLWQIIDRISFSGVLYAFDASTQMCSFLEKAIKRERKFTNNIRVINTTIYQAPQHLPHKSNFIISSFGFPSKISNDELCHKELKAVYDLLDDDGLFFTVGWDETFNDELSKMWYKFIPDQITALDFEEWRQKRATAISSPRNCRLKWFKTGISAPLQFSSIKEAAYVMGYLFGRDAAQHIINNCKAEWSISMGITCNTKKELSQIIKSL